MLKIKAERMKDLEKLGFEEKENCYSKYIERINYNDTHWAYTESFAYITVSKNSGQLLFGYSYKFKDTAESKDFLITNGISEYTTKLDLLYDLITSDMVDKVVEELIEKIKGE